MSDLSNSNMNESVLKDITVNREDVPDDVTKSLMRYLEKEFPDEKYRSKYRLEYVCRASNHPEDDYLYQVIAWNFRTQDYTAWTSWNQSTQSLNYGHYCIQSFTDAKSILNDFYRLKEYQGRGLDISDDVKECMTFIDDIVNYVRAEFGTDEVSVPKYDYRQISEQVASGSNTGLAFTTLSDDDIPLQVSVNLLDKTFTKELEVEEGKLISFTAFDSYSEMSERIPLDFDELTAFDEFDVDKALTGSYLAEAYKYLVEGGDRTVGNSFFEKLHTLSVSEDIYKRPATVAASIDRVSSNQPFLKNLCERFKDLMDTYCEMGDNTVDFGVYHKAKELREECRSALGYCEKTETQKDDAR